MPRFRKLPAVVEAEQWLSGVEIVGVEERSNGLYGYMRAAVGNHVIYGGDWIITNPDGKQHICRQHKFAETYERV